MASCLEVAPGLEALRRRTVDGFIERFGRKPRWIAAAPGRLNLIGEHTDYNQGFVLPLALERYTVIAADRPPAPGGTRQARFFSSATNEWASIDLESPIQPGEPYWSNYPRGVLAGAMALGGDPGPFEAFIDSTIPLGGGLSSSAALSVATATLIAAMAGLELEPLAKALLCQKAEQEFAGVPSGIMDQLTCVMGRAGRLLLIDCRSNTFREVVFDDPALTLLVANTNVRHALHDGEYARRQEQCGAAAAAMGLDSLRDAGEQDLARARPRLEPIHYHRARHVITENRRTLEAAKALEKSDWASVGLAMYESHESLRDDYQVSCRELDDLVELARSIGPAGGVIGSRMTGAGFGGCTVNLVRTAAVESVAATLAAGYLERTSIPATIFTTRAGPGAAILEARMK